MNATLRLPGLHGPGWGWLPPVLRRRAAWRTVGRFVLWGPLIGGLPYLWLVFSIPFAYVFGAVPAFGAGLLFAAWYHGAEGPAPGWRWRAVVGAFCGLAVTALTALAWVVAAARPNWTAVLVVGLHGVPAAVVLALLQRPESGEPGRTAAAAPARPAGQAVQSGVSSHPV